MNRRQPENASGGSKNHRQIADGVADLVDGVLARYRIPAHVTGGRLISPNCLVMNAPKTRPWHIGGGTETLETAIERTLPGRPVVQVMESSCEITIYLTSDRAQQRA